MICNLRFHRSLPDLGLMTSLVPDTILLFVYKIRSRIILGGYAVFSLNVSLSCYFSLFPVAPCTRGFLALLPFSTQVLGNLLCWNGIGEV